ncbi:MAG: hydrogenase expression/formation protein HypE [Bacillota bacterium]
MKIEKSTQEIIISSHGDGGLLTHQLLQEIFFPAFRNEWLEQAGDAAILELNDLRLAMTTDSFVVSPLFFKGGDIGKLAVCGTVNDLVVSGARPLWLSAAFILPEGMEQAELKKVVLSMEETARSLELPIVTGDTKVVDSGNRENLFINTTGIGLVYPEAQFHPRNIQPSDVVIASGSIGDHGAAILAERLGFTSENSPVSDCAPLAALAEKLKPYFNEIKVMRDPTRGGLATTLIELAAAGGVDLLLEEKMICVKPEVSAIAGILGVDPYFLASEGRAVLIARAAACSDILKTLKTVPGAEASSIIGVAWQGTGNAYLRTRLGGTRRLKMLSGTPLPRIC